MLDPSDDLTEDQRNELRKRIAGEYEAVQAENLITLGVPEEFVAGITPYISTPEDESDGKPFSLALFGDIWLEYRDPTIADLIEQHTGVVVYEPGDEMRRELIRVWVESLSAARAYKAVIGKGMARQELFLDTFYRRNSEARAWETECLLKQALTALREKADAAGVERRILDRLAAMKAAQPDRPWKAIRADVAELEGVTRWRVRNLDTQKGKRGRRSKTPPEE